MGRTLALGTMTLLMAVAAAAAALPAADTQAATPYATCTRGPDGIYNCDKEISPGKHIAVVVDAKVCHGNVLSAPSGPGGTAAVRILENVNACPWAINAVATFSFRVAQPATAVGGITDVVSGASEPLERPAEDAAGAALAPALAAALGVLAVATGASWSRRLLARRRR